MPTQETAFTLNIHNQKLMNFRVRLLSIQISTNMNYTNVSIDKPSHSQVRGEKK